jgi:hypothetical protein
VLASAISATVRFLSTAWRGAWAALLLTAAGTAGSVRAISGGETAGAAAVWVLSTVALAVVARGALWRLALTTGRPGRGGLQFGAVEGRIAAVWVLSLLFLMIVGLLLLTGLLCLVYAVASAGRGFDPANASTWAPAVDGPGRILIGAAMLAGTATLAWMALRISLAEAASVADGKVQVLSAWRRTRGRMATIAAGNLILAALTTGALLIVPAGGGGADWLRALVYGIVVAGAWLPLQVGLMAYAYERHAAPEV